MGTELKPETLQLIWQACAAPCIRQSRISTAIAVASVISLSEKE
jgi:hypothetical protein